MIRAIRIYDNYVHDSPTTNSDKESCFEDSLVILKRMFPQYHKHTDIFSRAKILTPYQCVIRNERVNP